MNAVAALVCVSIGAGLGAQLRYGLDLAFTRRRPTQAAHATLAANIAGSALIGVMVAVLNNTDQLGAAPVWAETLTAGLAGGLTTFSTLSAQVVKRAETSLLAAAVLAVLHAALGLAAAGAGWWVTWKFLIS